MTREKWWYSLGERFMQLWRCQPWLSPPSGARSSDEWEIHNLEMGPLTLSCLLGRVCQRLPGRVRGAGHRDSELTPVHSGWFPGEKLRDPTLTQVSSVTLGKAPYLSEPWLLCPGYVSLGCLWGLTLCEADHQIWSDQPRKTSNQLVFFTLTHACGWLMYFLEREPPKMALTLLFSPGMWLSPLLFLCGTVWVTGPCLCFL